MLAEDKSLILSSVAAGLVLVDVAAVVIVAYLTC